MVEPLIAVTGATGQVGSQLVAALLAKGRRVRALGRDTRLLARLGATERAQGSLDDRMYLGKSLRGVDAIFAMLPPNPASGDYLAFCRRISDGLVPAIAESGARQVVLLSSLGADQEAGTGAVVALHQLELRLRELPVHSTFLRAGAFLENHLAAIPALRRATAMRAILKEDLAFPQIAARDIAIAAAKVLLQAEPAPASSTVLELHGAKDYDMRMVARTLGAAIGRADLTYAQCTQDQARQGMLRDGMGEDAIRLLLEMQGALNDGRMRPLVPRSAATTTPTTLGQFAKGFATAFRDGR